MEFGVLLVKDGEKLEFADARAARLLGFDDSGQLQNHWSDVRARLNEAIASRCERVELDIAGADGDGQPHVVAHRVGETHRLLIISASNPRADLDRLHATQLRSMAALRRSVEHDFRGALNALALNVELLRGEVAGSGRDVETSHARQIRCLDLLAREVSRLPESLNKILSRLDPLDGSVQRFDMRQIVEEVHDLVGPQARVQRITLRVVVPELEVPIEGSRLQMRQALLNCCVNALQVLPAGGALDIELTLCDEWAVTKIKDNGPGVPSAYLSYGGRAESAASGHGSGLYMSDATVAEFGGMMRIESAEPSGTIVELRVPITRRS